MLICIINPNTTKKMTDNIEVVAKKVASNGTTIVSTNPKNGPESIEGYYDEVFCIPGLIEEVLSNSEADAYIIACFDDTGLDAIRTITNKPVLGIGDSSFHIASCLAGTFSVITTLDLSVPILKNNLLKRGFDRICVNVSSVNVPVLDLENEESNALLAIEDEIQRSITNDKAEAIVLGCAGMADFAEKLEKKFSVPVIEGVSSSIILAEGLVKMKKTTSKLGGYSYPRPKRYSGIFKPFEFKK
jgi:allantoin racemase